MFERDLELGRVPFFNTDDLHASILYFIQWLGQVVTLSGKDSCSGCRYTELKTISRINLDKVSITVNSVLSWEIFR